MGLHLPGMPAWEAPDDREPTEDERAFLDSIRGFRAEEMAYYDLQATKPQFLAYALQDSPVGLAAWFLEKWWEWADHPDDLWSVIGRDAFLTTVMLYWLPGRVLSASRIYYERAHANPSDRASGPITVPTWFAGFPRDPFTSAPPSLAVSGDYENIVHLGEQPRGGHFPALERPEAWAADVRAFFSTL